MKCEFGIANINQLGKAEFHNIQLSIINCQLSIDKQPSEAKAVGLKKVSAIDKAAHTGFGAKVSAAASVGAVALRQRLPRQTAPRWAVGEAHHPSSPLSIEGKGVGGMGDGSD